MSNSSRSRIQSHSGQPRLGNCREIADEYGIKYHTLLKLAHAGAFPTVKLPATNGTGDELRRILIDRSDLEIFLLRHKG